MKHFIYLVILLYFPLFSISQTKIIVVDPGHNYDDIANDYRTATEVNTN